MNSLPKATVLLSIYKPDETFFRKQLASLENQDYKNVEVFIWDDYPAEDYSTEIANILKKTPYTYTKCDENLGYIKAFAHMVEAAEGDFFAFCDQDDFWEPQKLSRSIEELQKQDAILATSARMIIDENDNIVIPNLHQQSSSPKEIWQTGDDISCNSVFTCYALGMTIVLRAEAAKQMLPFSLNTGHDKWSTMCAAAMGKVLFIDDVLQRYRHHSTNVSGALNFIKEKSEYYEWRVGCAYALAQELITKFPNHPQKERILAFANARKDKNVIQLFKLRAIAPQIAKFEILLKFMPAWGFRLVRKIIRGRH